MRMGTAVVGAFVEELGGVSVPVTTVDDAVTSLGIERVISSK